MLKTKAMEKYLEQAITPGIKGVFLFNNEGHPVAKTGKLASNASVYGALLVNIWETFEQQGIREGLQTVVLQNADGTVVVLKISEMMLVMIADKDIPQGVVNAKMSVFAEHLEEPLKQLRFL